MNQIPTDCAPETVERIPTFQCDYRPRHFTTRNASALSGQALAALPLTDGPGGCLRLTHAFRPCCAYRLQVSYFRADSAGGFNLQTHKSFLDIALKDYVQTDDAPLPLAGKTRLSLPAPAWSLRDLPARSRGQAQHMAIATTTHGEVLLPASSPPKLHVTEALTFLADSGLACNLHFDLKHATLDALALRRLAGLRQTLAARLHQANAPGTDLNTANVISRALKVNDHLQGMRGHLQIHAWLELPHGADPALASLVGVLLHGEMAKTNTRKADDLDLSAILLHSISMPSLIPSRPNVLARPASHTARERPPDSDAECIVLGHSETGCQVSLEPAALRQHLYMLGGTGVGKTTLLRHLIEQDIRAGRGVFVMDPHGDLYQDLVAALPDTGREDVVLADAGDFAAPFSLNILEVSGPHAAIQRNFVISQLIELFKSVYGANPEAFGPMFEMYFRGALMLLMDGGGGDATLADLERVFGDSTWRQELLEKCSDQSVISFWNNIALQAGGESSLSNMAPYIVAKLARMSGNPLIRPITCVRETTLDLPGALAGGKVVLVNLAKGQAGASEAAMLGGIITIRLFAAAMARAAVPPDARRLMRVYLDEFQTHAGAVLGEMMAEARKFGLSLVLANQSVAQVAGRGADIAHAILANCANLLSFRLGPEDAQLLAKWLGPRVKPRMLLDMPNHHCVARLMRHGQPQPAELVATSQC